MYRSTGTPAPIRRVAASASVGIAAVKLSATRLTWHLRWLVVVVEDEVPGEQPSARLALEQRGQLGVGPDPFEPLVEPVLGLCHRHTTVLNDRVNPYAYVLPRRSEGSTAPRTMSDFREHDAPSLITLKP
ncbi:hypothetical protein [Streptomyces sp. NBC_01506]|uniref:hypothetical protein n=1 Tax=Streptomyces sp. NBC_01506 TaxID=2903887 RepID=UPI003862EA76